MVGPAFSPSHAHSWVRAPPNLPRRQRFCYHSYRPRIAGEGMTRPMRLTLSLFLASSCVASVPPAAVIGFVGGFVKHDNAVHSEVQLAARLRQDYLSGVQVEVFENHRREKAH